MIEDVKTGLKTYDVSKFVSQQSIYNRLKLTAIVVKLKFRPVDSNKELVKILTART